MPATAACSFTTTAASIRSSEVSTADPALDGLDQEPTQRRQLDDGFHRPHPNRSLDAVDAVEALGEGSPVLRPHLLPQRAPAGPQALALRALGLRDRLVERLDPRVARGRPVDLAGEHDRRRRGAADHRGAGAFQRDRLQLWIELLREDHERAAVEP